MKWYKVRRPEDPGKLFNGRTITAYKTAEDVHARANPERILVTHIAGNLRHVTMFQINGTHLVSMLDAYCELNGEPLPNRELHEGFLSTVTERVEADKPAAAPSLIDRKPYGKAQ